VFQVFVKGIRFVQKNKRLPTIEEISRYLYWCRRRKPIMALPQFAQIEVTTRCNFRCVTCSRKSLPRSRLNRDMTLEEFVKIVKQIPTLKLVKLQGLGEPFLNEHLGAILNYCARSNIRCTTISNGSILPELDVLRLLDSITFSLDSAVKSNFEFLRKGSDFDLIVRNISDVVQIKKRNRLRVKVSLSMVVTHLNFEEMEKVFEMGIALGVDVVGFVEVENWYIPSQSGYQDSLAFISDTRKISGLIKEKVEFFRRKNIVPVAYLGSEPRKLTCEWPFKGVFITVDGFVTPCCIRMDPSVFNFGNIYDSSFKSIWNGEKYVSFRTANLRNLPNIVCEKCPD